jgi:hypothetical protein
MDENTLGQFHVRIHSFLSHPHQVQERGGDQWSLAVIRDSQPELDWIPSRMQGHNIKQRDCAAYHVGQSYKDCPGGERITANVGLLENY